MKCSPACVNEQDLPKVITCEGENFISTEKSCVILRKPSAAYRIYTDLNFIMLDILSNAKSLPFQDTFDDRSESCRVKPY